MLTMRKQAFPGILCAIALATLTMPSLAKADDDFSALLEDIEFKNALPASPLAQIADASDALAPPAAPAVPVPESLELPADPAPNSAPLGQEAPLTTPESAATHAAAPVEQVYGDQAYHDAAADGCSTCNDGCSDSCGGACSGHGHGCHTGHCQPYTPVRLPSSTFYQYWRSNACNVNVWHGYKNHCHGANIHTMGQCDCFKEKKGLLYGGGCFKSKACNKGCDIVEPCDCGPAPAEWCDSACDGR